MPVIDLVTIGCGARGTNYSWLASQQPERYRLVAAADPVAERVAKLATMATGPFRSFSSAAACFAAGRLGDVCLIATQDADHVAPCLQALALGYDVLLEKPVAQSPAAVLAIRDAAAAAGRKVIVCHVLRYAPLWSRVHAIIASGRLGEVVHIDHREGVGAWHQAHSYVRGHWADSARSNPMLLAKCCHDLDLILWCLGRPARRVSSFGALTHFRPEHQPAGATARCADGCAVRATCAYDCAHYAGRQRSWLWAINPRLTIDGTPDEIRAWVEASPWGRCVWAGGNDAVDHQVVSIDCAGATAALTMTAFDEGRTMTVCGTRGRLYAGDGLGPISGGCQLVVVDHQGAVERIDVNADAQGHGDADAGLIAALADELARPDAQALTTGIQVSVASHLLAFAAEASRHSGGTAIDLDRFTAAHSVAAR